MQLAFLKVMASNQGLPNFPGKVAAAGGGQTVDWAKILDELGTTGKLTNEHLERAWKTDSFFAVRRPS
jgi:hypothetical protein